MRGDLIRRWISLAYSRTHTERIKNLTVDARAHARVYACTGWGGVRLEEGGGLIIKMLASLVRHNFGAPLRERLTSRRAATGDNDGHIYDRRK